MDQTVLGDCYILVWQLSLFMPVPIHFVPIVWHADVVMEGIINYGCIVDLVVLRFDVDLPCISCYIYFTQGGLLFLVAWPVYLVYHSSPFAPIHQLAGRSIRRGFTSLGNFTLPV